MTIPAPPSHAWVLHQQCSSVQARFNRERTVRPDILPSGDVSDLNIVGVQQTADGGYAFAGYYFQSTVYTERAWLVKTDSAGNVQWDKIYGPDVQYSDRHFYSFQQTSDGGFIATGSTNQFNSGDNSIWLFRADARELWPAPPADVVNVENGLLDVTTLDLLPHSPNHLTSIQLPVRFDLEADSSVWVRFVEQTLPKDAVDIAWEIAAWAMTQDSSIPKAVALTGEGSNGKSVYLAGLTAFLGRRNICAVSLHQLFWWRSVQRDFKDAIARLAKPESDWERWETGQTEEGPVLLSTLRVRIVRQEDALVLQVSVGP